ncbi:hypothetical protein [Sessilibacter corallicola]|uniref:TMhelix containing protein n=1 Tax=Sessilibacter corallicola TaxID=2904075 RepID=A0ABQ0AF15_9GAMM
MDSKSEVIKYVAPTLATALNGPFSGVANQYLADKLTDYAAANDSNIDDSLTKALQAPEGLQKLKLIDKEFSQEMKKLNVDVFNLTPESKSVAKDKPKVSYKPQVWISLLFLVAYFAMLSAIFAVEVSDTLNMKKGDNSLMGELQILFGVLTAGVGQVLSYWFGGALKNSRQEAP